MALSLCAHNSYHLRLTWRLIIALIIKALLQPMHTGTLAASSHHQIHKALLASNCRLGISEMRQKVKEARFRPEINRVLSQPMDTLHAHETQRVGFDMRAPSFQSETLLHAMQSGARQTVCAWKALQAADGRATSGRAAKESAAIRLSGPTDIMWLVHENTTALKVPARSLSRVLVDFPDRTRRGTFWMIWP